MTTNPTDLSALSCTPPAISGFDYAALEAWAKGIAEKYHGLVVTEDQVTGIKSEMAHLNATKKKLDDARKEMVKRVSEPIKEFEAQIKAVCAIFDATYAELSAQVKNHEERAREQKRTEVLFAIETLTAEAGYPGLEIAVQDSWLNKTQKPKATADAIKALIADHIKAEKDAAALERAKQDRAEAIEDTLAALAGRHGFSIPASQFLRLQSLDVTWAEAREELCKAFEVKAESNARANAAPVAPAAQAPVDAFGRRPLVEAAQAAPVERVGRTIHLEYDRRRGPEVLAAMRALERLCLDFMDHAKPIADPGQYSNQPARAARPY